MRLDLVRNLILAAVVGAFAAACGDSATSGSGHADDDGMHTHDPGDPNAGDELAREACHGLHGEGTVVEAALDHAGAADVVLMPGDTTWIVQLPDGAPSFATLMLPTVHTDWAVFVDHPGVVVSITNHETNDRFDVTPESPNEACPDDMRVDARVHIHSDGHHIIEFSADGAREIRFQMRSESQGHGGHDADMVAQAACVLAQGEHTMIAAASTPEAALAGDVMMTGESVYHVMLPEGPAWAAVHLPTDHTDWAFFVSEPDLALSVANDDAGSFGITPHNPNAACPETFQVDSRIHIHAGGIFLVEFSESGPGHVLLNVASESEGHGGHDDGGHDDDGHDDGGHDDDGHDDGGHDDDGHDDDGHDA